ncbi:Transmembrane and TPR repeat-containing protein 3 [Trachymyrmex septentrionalis]|uniref:Transmembrane and TPR repeat-containing protein 3 n=1 Tax=Trachymyrmex septentrionalis TaxID=34720 RepID=A0A195EVV0_9HYME|nr:Transmembrane and TPR repeat-containing protein 3 [Trachymyrmex septentrionalis]
MRRRNNGSACFCQASSVKKGGRGGCNETEANEPPGWCIYAAVALVAVGCYLNALDCDFVHDDIPAVVRNRDVIGEASWSSVLNDDFWGTPMESINSHKSYRPFTTLTFRLNYLMAGLSPMWYHATNVALHAAACILVTRVSLVVAALRPGFAALTGLLFAAHPVHTEAHIREHVLTRRAIPSTMTNSS